MDGLGTPIPIGPCQRVTQVTHSSMEDKHLGGDLVRLRAGELRLWSSGGECFRDNTWVMNGVDM